MSSVRWQGQLLAFMYVGWLKKTPKSACLSRSGRLHLDYVEPSCCKWSVSFQSPLCRAIYILQNAFEAFVRKVSKRLWSRWKSTMPQIFTKPHPATPPIHPPTDTTCLFSLRFKIMSSATLPLCCDIPHLKASYMFWWIPVVWGWALNKKTGIALIAVKGVSKQLWVFNTICRSTGNCVIKPVNSTSEGRTVVLIRSLLKSLDHGHTDTLCSPRLSDIR